MALPSFTFQRLTPNPEEPGNRAIQLLVKLAEGQRFHLQKLYASVWGTRGHLSPLCSLTGSGEAEILENTEMRYFTWMIPNYQSLCPFGHSLRANDSFARCIWTVTTTSKENTSTKSCENSISGF